MKLITIDVSELQPPEPMTEILTSLSKLAPLQCLKVIHSREPFPLYQKLSKAGWGIFAKCYHRIKESLKVVIFSYLKSLTALTSKHIFKI